MKTPKNNKDPEIVSQETNKSEDPKTDPDPNSIYVTKGTNPSGEDLPLTQENVGQKSPGDPAGVQRVINKLKAGLNVEGIFGKAYKNEHGATKHYVKVDQAQEESTDAITGLEIMIYSDSKRECSYFTNLSDKEICSHQLFQLEIKSEE